MLNSELINDGDKDEILKLHTKLESRDVKHVAEELNEQIDIYEFFSFRKNSENYHQFR